MKKVLLSLGLGLIGLFSAQQASAQGAYVRVAGGYVIEASKDVVGQRLEVDANGVGISKRNLYGANGAGGVVRVAGGYMFTPHFGVDLDFSYLLGAKVTNNEFVSPDLTDITTDHTNQLRTTLSLVMDAGMEKISPFSRVGIMLPLMGKTFQIRTQEAPTYTYERTAEVSGSFSLGFEAGMGVRYNINHHLSVSIEAYYSAVRIKSNEATIVLDQTTDVASGTVTNNLEGASTFSTQIVFQDELTPSSNSLDTDVISTSIDFDAPVNLQSRKNNYNGVGFNVGIKYSFGHGE